MATMDDIPNEILISIAWSITKIPDIAAFALVCRRFFLASDKVLYVRGPRRYPYLLAWACEVERISTVKKLLRHGADPNIACHEYGGNNIGQHDFVCSHCNLSHAAHQMGGRNPWVTTEIISPVELWRRFYFVSDEELDRHCALQAQAVVSDEGMHSRLSLTAETTLSNLSHRSSTLQDETWLDDMRNKYAAVTNSLDASPIDCWLRVRRAPFNPYGEYWTPLHIAVYKNRADIVDLLLDHAADPDPPSQLMLTHFRRDLWDEYKGFNRWLDACEKWTPLRLAMELGLEDLCLQLLRRGASTYYHTKFGCFIEHPTRKVSLINKACARHLPRVVAELIRAGTMEKQSNQSSQSEGQVEWKPLYVDPAALDWTLQYHHESQFPSGKLTDTLEILLQHRPKTPIPLSWLRDLANLEGHQMDDADRFRAFDLLIKLGVGPNDEYSWRFAPGACSILVSAFVAGDFEYCRKLRREGAKIYMDGKLCDPADELDWLFPFLSQSSCEWQRTVILRLKPLSRRQRMVFTKDGLDFLTEIDTKGALTATGEYVQQAVHDKNWLLVKHLVAKGAPMHGIGEKSWLKRRHTGARSQEPGAGWALNGSLMW